MNRTVAALLIVVSSSIAHAQTASVENPATRPAPSHQPSFKGTWQGPSKVVIPGPGPKPGQSLPDYFQNLASGDRHPVPLHVLALGGSRGFHHDSVPAAMDAIYAAGRRTGLWLTEFATDFALVNPRGGGSMKAGFQPQGLKDFDAIVVAGASGDWNLTEQQKAALLAFVHEQGKGLVVIHAGLDANHAWRDYIDMIGGEMTGHPFNTPEKVLVPFEIQNESPSFPVVKHLPSEFAKQDELYVIRNWSRSDVNVLLRLDPQRLNYHEYDDLESQLPPDHDFPVAWTKRYGKGRVFASSLGHSREAFDDPDIFKMYTEAVKWSLGLSEGNEHPHPVNVPVRE